MFLIDYAIMPLPLPLAAAAMSADIFAFSLLIFR